MKKILELTRNIAIISALYTLSTLCQFFFTNGTQVTIFSYISKKPYQDMTSFSQRLVKIVKRHNNAITQKKRPNMAWKYSSPPLFAIPILVCSNQMNTKVFFFSINACHIWLTNYLAKEQTSFNCYQYNIVAVKCILPLICTFSCSSNSMVSFQSGI